MTADHSAENTPGFASEVRPILSRQCLPCHGPDTKTRKADLRLDRREGLLRVVQPGNAADSELIQRITTTDLGDRMPPPDHAESLSDAEISTLTRWISGGASWQKHWAFQIPQLSEIPDHGSSENPIDAFIAEKIATAGLEANGPASPRTLIRRVHLDLIGLPPTPDRVARFVADHEKDREGAWLQLVEELLASESFGERWASIWLDLARYADTKGYEQDGNRNIWPWRDWVIQAFDRDLPFDQFTIEQLAGDLIDSPEESTRLATAFHRNTMTNDEGGTQNEEFRVAAVVDRVNTTMQVWQGLTAGCAQCHDHKYDPLSQKEYYQFYDFFNQSADADRNNEHPVLSILGISDKELLIPARQRVEETLSVLDETARALEIPEPDPAELDSSALDVIAFNGHMPALCQELVDGRQESWPWVAAPEDAPEGIDQVIRQVAPAGQTRQVYFERSLHPHIVTEGDRYLIDARILEAPESMLLQVRLDDDTVWEHRAYWGTTSFGHGTDGTPSLLHHGDLPITGEWVRLEVAASKIGLEAGTTVVGVAMTQIGGKIEWGGVRRDSTRHTERDDLLGYQSFLDRWSENPSDLFDASIREALVASQDQTDSNEKLETWWKKTLSTAGKRLLEPQLQAHDQALKEQNRIEAKAVPVPVMVDLANDQARSTHILNRGSYLVPGDEVTAEVPQFLPPMDPNTPRHRLSLAHWLLSAENPLTARVHVNRVWEQLFGTGLVETLEDFGTQGALPSHPELLDWLAITWQQEDRWSHKALLRRIVTSETYRRSSRSSANQRQIDPENRLLSRATRIRLAAEIVRDQALSIGGILSPKKFGPPVFPPQPEGIWQVVYNGAGWRESEGEDRVRRSLYTFFRRTAPYPTMLTFDAPSRDVCQSRRIRTNTPLQALVMLNDPVVIEAAAGLARISLDHSSQLTESIAHAFERATCRPPSAQELDHLVQLSHQQQQTFELDPEAARLFLESGRWTLEEVKLHPRAATLMLIANVLMNLDEILVRG
ncbi:MAG: PSD1 and planctomycete cytochrome C domain-containing protein [Planctomycetota bacterium]|nr:PSD1 and planctomycete cytochrome C domain-containing protein [Planctomycetota bacterium]